MYLFRAIHYPHAMSRLRSTNHLLSIHLSPTSFPISKRLVICIYSVITWYWYMGNHVQSLLVYQYLRKFSIQSILIIKTGHTVWITNKGEIFLCSEYCTILSVRKPKIYLQYSNFVGVLPFLETAPFIKVLAELETNKKLPTPTWLTCITQCIKTILWSDHPHQLKNVSQNCRQHFATPNPLLRRQNPLAVENASEWMLQ